MVILELMEGKAFLVKKVYQESQENVAEQETKEILGYLAYL
jgi:hypothetical protein